MSAEFELLADGLGAGPPPTGWVAIVDMPVLILVGVTGVGKSTTVDALRTRMGAVSLLPNRRKLADLLVIPAVQSWDGDPPTAVTDRRRRFDYTGRYRQRYPGGLAHAFSRLVLQKQAATPAAAALNIFDGLRGADEVTFAAQNLPLARFAVLNAPDVVRVERLLQRQDAFDQVGGNTAVRFCWERWRRTDSLHARGGTPVALVTGRSGRRRLAAKPPSSRRAPQYDPHAAVKSCAPAPDRTVVVDTPPNPRRSGRELEGLAAS